MANLSFLAGLNEQQRQYAEIIRARAEELGCLGIWRWRWLTRSRG
jgi:hypothetical protein